MKVEVFLILVCLFVSYHCFPIELEKNEYENVKHARQASNNVESTILNSDDEDDDDDDDEEDDIEDALVDDDDEDEDEDPVGATTNTKDDDEDEDEDYIERIFEDILDDDDDEDDDENDVSSAIKPHQVSSQSENQASASSDVNVIPIDYPSETDQTVFYDEENAAIDTKVDVSSLSSSNNMVSTTSGNSFLVQKISRIPQSSNTVSVTDDDDEDDDDDDDIEGALEDDNDEDDDDDVDDIIGDDVIEAKRAHSIRVQPLSQLSQNAIQRYNAFVDMIFTKINNIFKKSYDPLKVYLTITQDQDNRRANQLQKNAILIDEQALQLHAFQELRSRGNRNQSENSGIFSMAGKNEVKTAAETHISHGIMKGISSLKRVGNVKLTQQANLSIVKSKFTLGPLILKVEKVTQRGDLKETRSVSARTSEMLGRITFSIFNGTATLLSIKVQQPKQVQMDGNINDNSLRQLILADNSDMARDVSDKIHEVTVSVLKPSPFKN